MADTTSDRIHQIVNGVVAEDAVEVIEIQLPRFKTKQIVRIFIDKESGVTLDDCRRISKKVGERLEIEDLFPSRYVLEVSSPGLDRPLTTVRDFKRNTGRSICLVTRDAEGEKRSVTGVVQQVAEEAITLETSGGIEEIPLRSIVQGKVCISI